MKKFSDAIRNRTFNFIWNDNIKMDIKETSFFFRLNSSLQHRTKGGFLEVLMRMLKNLQLKLSEDEFRSVIFLDLLILIAEKLTYA
jgi:hypothetical protein